MMNGREMRKEVFLDTQRFYEENEILRGSILNSKEKTVLFEADDYPELPVTDKDGQIKVIKGRTFETAMKLHRKYPDQKIGVLNFASAVRPGGGVKLGSSAQEESLCRCSTLYPVLDRKWLWEKYYDVNRNAHDALHSDAVIYTPDIIICRTDEAIPQRMGPADFVKVDVLSCAAPDLKEHPHNMYNPETAEAVRISADELYALHVQRAKHILHVAAYEKIDVLVLGAFGCGAFANDPWVVAKAYRDVLKEYKEYFTLVDFAVYVSRYDQENYEAFMKTLS